MSMILNKIYNYYLLTKPNVMYLSVISSISTYVYGVELDYKFIYFLIGIMCGSGAAGVFNMCLEVDNDSKMTRTSKRPLVEKKITLLEGYIFGFILLLISIYSLSFCSFTSVYILLFTVFFYSIVYTLYLKPLSDMNIVIGGLAGALPVLIGWYASHDYFHIFPYLLCITIVFWTPAHFWALSIYRLDDYRNINLPMRPITVGIVYTTYEIVIYTLFTVIFSFLSLYYVRVFPDIYTIALYCILNIYFFYKAVSLFYTDNFKSYLMFFLLSVKYLFIILMILIYFNLKYEA